MADYRVQVYIRRRGETILDGNEFKTEHFDDQEELKAVIDDFIKQVIYDAEEGNEDDD